jgi:hypothetical protein
MHSAPIIVASRSGYFAGGGVLDLEVSPALSRCLPGPRTPDELDNFILSTGAARRRKVRAYEFDLNFPKSLSVLIFLSDYECFRRPVRRWVRMGMFLLRHLATADSGFTPPRELPSWCLAVGIVEGLARPVEGGRVDPLLHAHIVLCTQAMDPSTGQRLPLDLERARTAWPAIQKYLHLRAAHDLRRHGIAVLGTGGRFSLAAVPPETEVEFSGRMTEVKAAGLRHNRFRQGLSKLRQVHYSGLLQEWQARVPADVSRALLTEAQRMQTPPQMHCPWSEVDHDATRCLEQAAGRHLMADELEIMAEVPAVLLGSLSPNRLRRSLRRLLGKDRRYRIKTQEILSFDVRGHLVYASQESADLAASTLPLIRATHGQHAPWLSVEAAEAEAQQKMKNLLLSMAESRDALVILQLPDDGSHWELKKRLCAELSSQATVRAYLGESVVSPESWDQLFRPFAAAHEQLKAGLNPGEVVWIEGADGVNPQQLLKVVELGLSRSARMVLSVSAGQRPLKSATGLLPMLRLDAGVSVLGATKASSRGVSCLLTDLRFSKGVELVREQLPTKEVPLEMVASLDFHGKPFA